MVSSALNYANRLKKNNNKGPLGQVELFDTSVQVSKKTKLLFELLSNSSNTIVHTGAGVSTGSGIPDFRGPTGIWTIMDNIKFNNSNMDNKDDEKPKRRKLTDANCIPTRDNNSTNSNKDNNEDKENDQEKKDNINKENNDTNSNNNNKEEMNEEVENKTLEVNDREEYVLYGNNRKKAVEFILALPSETHLCLLELMNRGVVNFIITQNIDGLHALSGIPFDKLSELHGNVFVQRCLYCARRFQRSYVAPTISFQSTGDLCGICSFPPFNLLTDVVLDWFDCYEEHFEENSMNKAQLADFHLVLGSSLHIEPACHYASDEYYRNPNSPLVIVNYQSTKLDPECDLIIHEDVNKVCNILLKKFQLSIPTFIRKSYMIILKYQLKNNYCILLMKLSCILDVELIDKFSLNKNNNNNNKKDNINNNNSNENNNVKIECINKLQGIYKFTFNRKFKLRLKLFYNTQMELEIPYERVVLFKGEIWELDLCATNGSKVKLSPRTFSSKCCNFCINNNDNNNNNNNKDNNSNTSNSNNNMNTNNTSNNNTYTKDNNNNNNNNSNTFNNFNKDNNNYYGNTNNKFVDNESIMIDGLIHINKMTISYNSHLVQDTPYRLVGYLDLINKKSGEYQEFKLSNNLVILSYLWASNFIQNVNLHQHESKVVKEYFEESRMFNKLIFSYGYNKDDYKFHLLEDDNANKKKENKKKVNRYLDEVLKSKVKEENEDALEGYYDKYLSNTYTTNKSGSESTKNEDNNEENKENIKKENNIKNEYNDNNTNRRSSYDTNNNKDKEKEKENNEEMKDNIKKENNEDKEIKYDNRDRSSSCDSERDGRRDADRSKRSGRITNITTKRKDTIWSEITECNKFAEMVINKSLRSNLIRIKYTRVIPKLDSLNLESYLFTLQSSLPLKLFVSKNVNLGYLVKEVPNELVESNKVGNYRNYDRLFRYYDLPSILDVFEELKQDKENNLLYVLDHKEVFRKLGANLYEILVYNVINMSSDLEELGNYIIIKLFYNQLPLWILKYLSDLFECR